MVESVGISKEITSFNDLHSKFNLSQTDDLQFFTEWFEGLPDLSDREKSSLDRLKNRFFYYLADGAITEGTINLIMLSPLLELVGLFDPLFKLRGEQSVKVEWESEGKQEEALEGRIDALIVQNQFWLVVIEAKRYLFDPMLAIPQTVAYMMANPHPERFIFGMAMSGNDYIFVKLNQQMRQYDLSDKWTLSTRRHNELYEVVRVMKRIISLF